jgi:stage V sporulation protein AA
MLVPTIHLRLQKRIQRPEGYLLTLKDIAKVVGPDSYVQKLNPLPIQKANPNRNQTIVIDILTVIEKIQSAHNDLQIQYIGDLECIVDINKKKPTANWVFLVFAWLLLFFGSGLAVMDFHADVGMMNVHRKLYTLLTGYHSKNPLWIQVPYSFGLGLGMIIFFNRWFKQKVDQDPNPLDIEMQTYQDNINKCVIAQDQSQKQRLEAEGQNG